MSFRICLIGCGGMAESGHGPMMRKYATERPGVELAACCDISSERAESFASRFGFAAFYTDIGEMLDTVRPHGAVLAVPMELTARLAVEILKRRIPLLTEKPPGLNLEEGHSIAAAARAAGVPVSAAFNRRTMPLVQALLRELDAVGVPVDSVRIEMLRVNRTEPDFSMTAIHDVDLARVICRSDYQTVRFSYHVHGNAAPAADIHALARMESGAAVQLSFLPMCGMMAERILVTAHEHTFLAELPIYASPDAPGRVVHFTGNRTAHEIIGETADPAEANGFFGEHALFFDALRNGRTPEHSVEGSLQSLDVACAISHRLPEYVKGGYNS